MPVLDCFAGSMGEKNKVRRCLFGRPDHDSLRKDLDEQLRSTKCGMKSTWNFDCDSDKPLLGRYEWTLIKQEEDVPSYYFKGYRPTKFRKMVRDSECELNSVSSQVTPFVSRISGLETEDSEDLQRDNETTPELRPSQKQSRIDGKLNLSNISCTFSGLLNFTRFEAPINLKEPVRDCPRKTSTFVVCVKM